MEELNGQELFGKYVSELQEDVESGNISIKDALNRMAGYALMKSHNITFGICPKCGLWFKVNYGGYIHCPKCNEMVFAK